MNDAPSKTSVVITGASSGFGAELARLYAAEGVSLGLIGRDRDRLEAVAEACRQKGANVELGRLDVRDAGPLSEWLLAFDDAHPVEVLIAAAGISAGVRPGAVGEDDDLAVRQIAVNLVGAMNTLEPLVPRMAMRGRGALAVVSSVAGLRGLPYSPGYSASKAGVRAYGEALRALLAPTDVKMTVITPGFFDTPMTDRWQGSTPFLWSVERTARAAKAAIDRGQARLTFPWPLAFSLRLADLAPPWLVDPILRSFHFSILPPAP